MRANGNHSATWQSQNAIPFANRNKRMVLQIVLYIVMLMRVMEGSTANKMTRKIVASV